MLYVEQYWYSSYIYIVISLGHGGLVGRCGGLVAIVLPHDRHGVFCGAAARSVNSVYK